MEQRQETTNSGELLQLISEVSLTSIACYMAVRAANDRITDFEYLYQNKASLQQHGGKSLLGRCIVELNPGIRGTLVFERFVKAVETGETQTFEEYDEANADWYRVQVVKLGDGVITSAENITTHKKAEEELEKNKRLLESVLNAAVYGLVYATAVYDDKGGIIDLEYQMANRFAANYLGQDIVGKRFLELYPDNKETERLQQLVHVIETGELQDVERYYEGDGYANWYRNIIVRLNDGLVISFEDITERKKAEQEIKEQAHFIRSVTDIAPAIISITEYPSGETVFNNRDPYVALGFETDELVQMKREDRLNLVHPADQQKLKDYYTRFEGMADKEELRIEYKMKNKSGEWLWLETTGKIFKRNAAGKVSHLLHIAQDITAQKRAEQEILRLKDEIAQKVTDKYYSVFNSIDEGFCIIEVLHDADGKIKDLVFCEQNPSFHKLTGLGNVVGKRGSDLLPNLEKYWIELLTEAAKTGGTTRSENFVQDLNRWFSVHVLKVGSKESPLLAVIFDDVTERKFNETNAIFLKEVSELLLYIENIDEAMMTLCEKIGTHFGAAVCAFSEVNEAAGTVKAPYIWHRSGAISPTGIYKIDEYHSKEVQLLMHAGKPEIVYDTASFPEPMAGNSAALHIGAYVNLPFVREGQWRATLSITDSKPRKWRSDEIELMQDLTFRIWTRMERVRTEEELRISQQMLSKKLDDSKQLQQISNRIIEEDNIQSLYEAILDSAIELMNSDLASIQILIPETNQLYLLAHRGFHPDSAKYWEYVEAGPTSSCGMALATAKRVVVQDMENPSFDMDKGDYDSYHLSGIFSVQSTPLVSRTGNQVGMMSTHWRKPHYPTEREFNLFDVLARQTADLIERKRGEEALRESEYRLKELNEGLERLVEQRTQELIRLKLKQEKEKLNAVIFAQEQERIRIGEGLHNGVAQLLFAVQSRLQLVHPAEKNESENLQTSIQILLEAIEDTKRISFQLMPPVLKDFGLAVALETYIRRILGEKIRMKLNVDLQKRLTEDLEISIYRIVQEAMNNIVKHAQATEANVDIHTSKNAIKIKVADNGKGFSLKEIAKDQKGIGLQTIKNRIKLLDGKIKFNSVKGKGTMIAIHIPVSALD